MSCFVIAEAGVNHNGDEQQALRLIEAAAKTGADAVKFQTFSADTLVTRGTAKAAYQEANTGAGDQHSMLRALELPHAAYPRLRSRALELGIEFMSTPFDEAAVDMLLELGVRRLKVPSGELTNLPFLEYVARTKLPIILSTGMGTLDEVREAVGAIRACQGANGGQPASLTLLHCTSNYPAAAGEVNLRAMQTLRQEFDLPVGYSDHTAGALASVAAVAAGASMVEKHFTLARDLPGPDHRASLPPEEFGAMVAQIRSVETMLGSSEKKPCAAELPVRDLVRRSVTLRHALRTNSRIGAPDLVLLRPGTGIPPKDLAKVIGRRAARDLPAGTTLRWSDLEE